MGDESLTRITLRAAKWSYSSTIITSILQILVTAVLARLVAPAAFGVLAMASVVLRFGQYFAQMGVTQSLIQRVELSPAHERAGFWASVLVGLLFSGMAWLLAPFAGVAFKSAMLVPILRAMGLTFFIGGTSSAAGGLLRRRMMFKELAVSDVWAYGLGYAGLGIALALSGFGVWSLVGASLGQGIITSLLYNMHARIDMRPVLCWAPYRDLLWFGTTVSLISFLEFIDSNLDNIVVGRLSGADTLGYYSKAMSLTGIPMQYMSTSLSGVLLPSFSRVQDERRRLGDAYLSVITLFAGIGFPVALGMSAAARDIVDVLLGHRWGASVVVMRFAAVAAVMSMLSHFSGILLEATAHLKEKLVMRSGQLILFAILLVLASRFGLMGYAFAFMLSEGALYAAMNLTMDRTFGINLKKLFGAHIPGILTGVTIGMALFLESWLGHRLGLSAFVLLMIEMASASILAGFIGLRVKSGRLYDVLSERFSDARISIPQPVARLIQVMAGRS